MRFTFEPGKRPFEILAFSIDFAKDLAKISGDTVAALAVTASKVSDGSDASGLVVDSYFVGSVCWGVLSGGVADENYLLDFKVTSANSKKYEHDILVPVRADA